MAYLIAGDVDGLVDNNYHEDATFVAFDFTVRGREALKYQFGMYLRWIGLKEVVSTDKFTATDDSIFFEATVVTNRGIGRIFDVFMMRDGKISHHFTGVK
ncbi:MAG: nuclear transport factor 2 family protein [Chloroflexia bacterium]